MLERQSACKESHDERRERGRGKETRINVKLLCRKSIESSPNPDLWRLSD